MTAKTPWGQWLGNWITMRWFVWEAGEAVFAMATVVDPCLAWRMGAGSFVERPRG